MYGKLFREEREKQGLTRKQVAKRTGVTETAIYHWENELREISLKNADALAKALGIKLKIGDS